MRDVEGFSYDKTLDELKMLYPADDEVDEDPEEEGLSGVPDAIRSMLSCRTAIEALGSMIWSELLSPRGSPC